MTTAAVESSFAAAVVILVPYRPASDRHRWLWDMVRPHLEQFGWPIFVGSCEGPWQRAVAVNNAAKQAGDWEIAFIADCDTLTDPDGIRRGVEWVRSTRGACRPHDQRYMLDDKQSLQAVQRGVGSIPREQLKAPYAGGGLDIVHRDAWDAVGGFDENYVGWGWEDSEFHVQLVVKSTWDRLPGVAFHLFHPSTDPKPNPESRRRFQQTEREHRKALQIWAAPKGLREPMRVF